MIALICACLLAAPPPQGGLGRRAPEEVAAAARAAAAVPQTFNLRDWIYPGDREFEFSGHAPWNVVPGVGQRGCRRYNRFSRTADDFDKVRDHYCKLVGLGPGGGNAFSGDADAVANSWPDRPVKLALVSRRYGMISVSVMISRDQGEAFTYITLVYRQVTEP
jgi:hypothetical protein